MERTEVYFTKNVHMTEYLSNKGFDYNVLYDGYPSPDTKCYCFPKSKELYTGISEYDEYVSQDKSNEFVREWGLLFIEYVTELMEELQDDVKLDDDFNLCIRLKGRFKKMFLNPHTCLASELAELRSTKEHMSKMNELWDRQDYSEAGNDLWRDYVLLNKDLNERWNWGAKLGYDITLTVPPRYQDILLRYFL